jgi:hypothetical protein
LQQYHGWKLAQIGGIPPEALCINRRALAKYAVHSVLNSNAPPHVKRGAIIDERIWKD